MGTELRSKTLASFKPEISQALDSLLEESTLTNEAKVLRTAFQRSQMPRTRTQLKAAHCASKQNDHKFQHFVAGKQNPISDQSDPEPDEDNPFSPNHWIKSTAHRVSTKQSPHLKVFYNHHAVRTHVTYDTILVPRASRDRER
jgi:hypothetical protein